MLCTLPVVHPPVLIARLSSGLYSINSDCAQVTYSVVAPALAISFQSMVIIILPCSIDNLIVSNSYIKLYHRYVLTKKGSIYRV